MVRSKNVKLLYSKKQINEAWKRLATLKEWETDENSLKLLNNWRAVHDYPMNTFQSLLRSKVKSLRYSAIIVERLKRTYSIVWKLKRNPDMMLARMQDIWWLRVVVRDVDYVYRLRDELIKGRFAHKLIREDDYIKKPKTSWYRSLHMVYKYQNAYAPEYNGLQIEIQLRTELEHLWATAVETMWIILQVSLKSWEWSKDWLDFFSLVSSLFAIKEWCVPLPQHQWKDVRDLRDSLIELEKKLDAYHKMDTYNRIINFIDTKLSKKKKLYEHYLLILNIKEHTIKVRGFEKWHLEEATANYLEEEKKFKDENVWQVVLVAWESLLALRHAYPNYFWNTKNFLSHLKTILSN